MKFFKRNNSIDERGEMSFLEHLDVLRGHLVKSAVAVAIGAIVMAVYNSFIVKKILMGPTQPEFPTYSLLCRVSSSVGLGNRLCMEHISVKMQSTVVGGQFGVYFNIILIGGFI